MTYKKKLIEVALPLEDINKASAREKSIRRSHPSNLHLWWARRPLAAARAVIWSSLVDDPSAHPEKFPTEESQNTERERLFDILCDLVIWENSNNPKVLDAAKAEIMKSTDGNPPALLDPFAGGGAIPLEAQRLGLKAFASDLNPVAVMINKAMIEIPPKFAGQPPINPESKKLFRTWESVEGLAEDINYYGRWMKQEAVEKIGHLYPKVEDDHGNSHNVVAWLWARVVKCPNPACGRDMPLIGNFELSRKKDQEAYIQPIIDGDKIHYEVRYGKNPPEGTMLRRNGAICIFCNQNVDYAHIKAEGNANRIEHQLIAIVAEGKKGRLFFPPNDDHIKIAEVIRPESVPEGSLPTQALGFVAQLYGPKQFADLYTNRQMTGMLTLSGLVKSAKEKVILDGGSKEYAEAVSVYLAFAVSKTSNRSSSLCTYKVGVECPGDTFTRQALAMTWDFAEANILTGPSGSFESMLKNTVEGLRSTDYHPDSIGLALQLDAQKPITLTDVMISTDPPYYDNIGYADLSDYFYIWLRQSLCEIYPQIFNTILVPKTEELVANPYRFKGGANEARMYFEDGMLATFTQIHKSATDSVPVSVYYAYKQTDNDANENLVSTGWETMLSAIINAGFSITGTWPISTERVTRTRSYDSNALASSIVIVCRKRSEDAPISTRRDFINTLKQELKPALKELQKANIAPVDLAQSAIGPGIGVYSRYSQVLESDGTPMSVRSALRIINQELDLFLTEQDGELDSESRFCIDLYKQFAFNDVKFGEADVLARAKNTSVDALANRGAVYAQRGIVRLLTREELPQKPDKDILWLLTQQLTYAMETKGVAGAAQIVANISTSEPERAKALAYRLYTIAERKKWAAEAFVYNSLVTAWSDVQRQAAQLRTTMSTGQQAGLFD